MSKRFLPLIILLALTLLAIQNSPVQARSEQTVLSGWVSVTRQTDPGKCIHPDRLLICRDRASVIRVESNDARFTGEASIVVDSITTKTPAQERVKGDFLLDNGVGAWVGTWKGSTDAQGNTLFTAEGYGSGDYEGLVFRLNMWRSNSHWRESISASGTIEKGSLPARRR